MRYEKDSGKGTNKRYAMIATFYIALVGFLVISYIAPQDTAYVRNNEMSNPPNVVSLISLGCFIAAFVLSINNLLSYKEKGYPVTILVITSIVLLGVLIVMFI
jgi:hypothetical protein